MRTLTRFAFVLLAALTLGAGHEAVARPDAPPPYAPPHGTGAPAALEPRIALVIGNANYADEMKLANPANDAELIGATLKKLGFDVILLTDSSQKAMQRAMVDFGARLSKAGPDATGLFYYAGHGLQVDGENYLVPVDANIASEADVEIDAVHADLVLKQMAFAGSRVNIVILDSCRNNPLARDFRSVASAQGFSEIRSKPKGTFISYSTAPGEVAVDGSNGHSPFATALAEVMQLPGLDLPEVFQRVRERVLDATDQKQTPWDSSSLVKSFYFVPPKDAQPAADLVASAEAPAATPVAAVIAAIDGASSATTAATAVRNTQPSPETIAALALEPVFVAVDHAFYAKPGSRMRAAPSTGAEVLAKLPTNAPLHAVARSADGSWWQVATADGRTGFVNRLAVSEFRTAVASASTASASLQLASATRQQGSSGGSGIGFVDQAFDWIADAAGTKGKPAHVVTRSQH